MNHYDELEKAERDMKYDMTELRRRYREETGRMADDESVIEWFEDTTFTGHPMTWGRKVSEMLEKGTKVKTEDVEKHNIEKLKQQYIEDEFGSAFIPSSIIGHREERKQVGGDHYQLPIQPIDYIVQNDIPYREANIIKYVTRYKNKNGLEDLKKAQHYLEMLIEEF